MVRLLGWSPSDVTQTLETSFSPAPIHLALTHLVRVGGSHPPGPLASGHSCSCFILELLFSLAPGSTLDAPFLPVPLSGSKVTLPLDDSSERLLLFTRQGRSSLCVFSFSVTKSCPTLCNPVNCSPPGSSVHRSSQARILDWVAVSFSRRSS